MTGCIAATIAGSATAARWRFSTPPTTTTLHEDVPAKTTISGTAGGVLTNIRLKADAVAWREAGDEVLALDLNSSTYISANSSAVLLWKMLAEGTSREALVARLMGEYGIDESRAGVDVDAFVADLDSRGLLQRS
jgi:Coenzyme PQQ synthesis protein D (PqqD)